MAIRNYLKKLGKRAAGTWGRINHPRDMRAESKAIRKQGKHSIKGQAFDVDEDLHFDLLNDEEPH
jgi:hypothetical protein